MKFGRFRHKKGEMKSYYGTLAPEGTFINVIEDFDFCDIDYTGRQYELTELEYLPPVQPTKIVAVGLNYKNHAQEMQKKLPEEPLLFIKPSSGILPHLGCIVMPAVSKKG